MQYLRRLIAVALLAIVASGPALALSPSAFQVLFSGGWWLPGASVDMNFAQAKYYGCDISCVSVTRASTGLAQTASGTWLSFAANVPRITDQGFLIEEARTNVLTNSQVFNSWPGKTDVTILDNNVLAPDNTTTGALVTEGSVGTAVLTSNAGTVTASTASVGAIFLRKSGTQWFRIVYADSTATDGFNLWVDLTNGVLGANSNRGSGLFTSASITAYANGWYRVAFSGTLSTRTNANIIIASATANGSTTRVAGATYYVWQGDVNSAASFITSPIVTTNASATRAADVPQLIGPAATAALAAKAMYVQTNLVTVTTTNRLFAYDGASGVGNMLYPTSTTTVQITNGTNSANATFGAGTNAGLAKLAFGFDATSMTAVANGGTKGTSANAWVTGTTPYLGNISTGVRALNGYMQRFALSPSKGLFDGATVP